MSDMPPPTADDRADGINQGLALREFDDTEPATVRNAYGLAELAWQARAVAKSVTLPQALQNKPESRRYGRFETWTNGTGWHAETTDYFRSWTGSGETEAEALAALAENLLADREDWNPEREYA